LWPRRGFASHSTQKSTFCYYPLRPTGEKTGGPDKGSSSKVCGQKEEGMANRHKKKQVRERVHKEPKKGKQIRKGNVASTVGGSERGCKKAEWRKRGRSFTKGKKNLGKKKNQKSWGPQIAKTTCCQGERRNARKQKSQSYLKGGARPQIRQRFSSKGTIAILGKKKVHITKKPSGPENSALRNYSRPG